MSEPVPGSYEGNFFTSPILLQAVAVLTVVSYIPSMDQSPLRTFEFEGGVSFIVPFQFVCTSV
jgi:hypothetical protein